MTPALRPAAPARWAQSLTAPLAAALQHPWVESIVRLSAVEDSLAALHPMLSLTDVRARVLRVIDETPTTRSFVLQPNALWRGARAGQFVRVRAEIDGRRVERVYSLSSRPGSRRLAITVRHQDGGLMSTHLHQRVRAGAVLTISQAAGEFVLPDRLPARLLLASAGSGITPLMAMLRDLQARQYTGNVVLHHVCRNADDFIFGRELRGLALRWPALTLTTHFSETAGRFDVAMLPAAVPDLAQRETWMCGPPALMDAVDRLWRTAGFGTPLHSERFAALPLLPASAPGTPVLVAFATSGRSFTTTGHQPLLVQAEQAGLSPKHGCRIGICRSCQCTKRSGTVENLQTGEISSTPNELIRLCISAARSDIALDL